MIFLFYLSIGFFLLICTLLCFLVLSQESKSLGLGASFGGDPGQSLFGTSTAEVLKKITAWMALIFMLFCLLLSIGSRALGSRRLMPVEASEEISR